MIIVPVSTSLGQAARGPTAVPLAAGIGGLPADSLALCHQVTTLDGSKLVEPIGRLPSADLARVAEGLKAALDLT